MVINWKFDIDPHMGGDRSWLWSWFGGSTLFVDGKQTAETEKPDALILGKYGIPQSEIGRL